MTLLIVDTVVGLLLVASGVAVLVAALGLVRLREFFQRMHAPAIAYTLGVWTATLALVIDFSLLGSRTSLNAWLVTLLLALTAPVTTALLARAALFRRRYAGDDGVPPPLGESGRSADSIAPSST